MVAIDVLLSYAIQFFVPIQVMFPPLAASSKFATQNPVLSELLFRSAMVFLTYVITMAVPNLKTLLSLVGSVCSTLLVFVFPVVCELILTNNNRGGISWWYWLKDSVILLLALVGFVLGGGLNIKEIIEEFMQ